MFCFVAAVVIVFDGNNDVVADVVVCVVFVVAFLLVCVSMFSTVNLFVYLECVDFGLVVLDVALCTLIIISKGPA